MQVTELTLKPTVSWEVVCNDHGQPGAQVEWRLREEGFLSKDWRLACYSANFCKLQWTRSAREPIVQREGGRFPPECGKPVTTVRLVVAGSF